MLINFIISGRKSIEERTDERRLLNSLKLNESLNELRKTGVIDDENDLSSPKGLFKVVHDQALNDGYINDLTSILSNLVTIPASGDIIWTNIARIVQEACRPDQQRRTVTGRQKTFNNVV